MLSLVLLMLIPGMARAERYALVIGNSNYESAADLPQTAEDARAVAQKLEQLGFTLIGGKAHTDLSRADMLSRIRDFGRAVKPGDSAVFYYSGHGIGGVQTNYLLPSNDGYIETREDVDVFAVDVADVMGRLPATGNGVNIYILDACRDNPLPTEAKSAFTEKGLVRVSRNLSNTVLLYAAEPGKPAYVSPAGKSYFTEAFLSAIDEPDLDLTALVRRLRREVYEATLHKPEPQRPWMEGVSAEPFSFADQVKLAVPNMSVPSPVAGFSSVPVNEEIREGLPPPPIPDVDLVDPMALEAVRTCRAGDLSACTGLGVAFFYGQGAPQEMEAGAELYKYACENGSISACSFLGAAHRAGMGVETNYSEAKRLFEGSCNQGFAPACTGLGELHMVGLAIPQNYQKGIEFYTRGCEGGDYMGCYLIGVAHASGVGLPLDYQKAQEKFKMLCDRGFFQACNDMGLFHQNGLGGTIDLSQAETFYRKACDGFVPLGCANLAVLYSANLVPTPESVSVDELYMQACEISVPDLCGKMGYQLYMGQGILPNRITGRNMIARACARGSLSSCQTLDLLP